MKYEEIKVGQTAWVSRVLTQDDVNKFIELTGDNNKVHTGSEYGVPMVHGMLGASFISTVIGTKLPGDGALWYEQSLIFKTPARVGDTLIVKAEVLEKNERDRTIWMSTDIYNQNDVLITQGKARVMVLEEKIKEEKPDGVKRTALVVGGMGGIGSAVCEELTNAGINVITADREKGDIIMDVLRYESAEYVIQEINRPIDILINCASIPIQDTPFETTARHQVDSQLEMHLFANICLAGYVVGPMIMRGYGKIIHIGSIITDRPHGHWLSYIVAKEALWGFTKALSYELAPKGIRVNMVSPSLVETNLTADFSPKTKMILESQTPLRKTTTAKEVAIVIAFLASEAGDSITGQNIRING